MKIRTFITASRISLALAGVMALTACGGAQERAHQHFERGRALFEAGNYDKARLEFKNALQIDPNSVEALYLTGETMEKLQSIRDAVGSYRRVLELDKSRNDARTRLGQIYLLGGAVDEARKLVDEGLALAPRYPGLLVLRGGIRARSGDVAGALEDGQDALKLEPDNVEAVALLSSLYRSQGRTDDAIAVLKGGLERHPDHIPTRLVLAAVYSARGETEEAERLLKEAISIDPHNFDLKARLAAFYVGLRRPDQAEAVLREAIEREPNELRPKLALVEFLYKTKDAGAAEQALQQFIEREPKTLSLRTALAGLYEDTRRPDEAEKTYRGIIAQDAKGSAGVEARSKLAALLWRSGKTAEAEKEVAAVLADNPRDNAALLLRAEMALSKNRADDAIAALRVVLKDQPNAVGAMQLLARAHLMNNEAQLARDQLQQAVALAPQDRGLRLQLAQLIARLADPDGAEKHLQEILKVAPRDAETLETLVGVKVAQKDFAAAHASARRLRDFYPESALGDYLDGQVFHAEKNAAEAARSYERAVAKAKKDVALPLTALVGIHLEQGQAPKALAAVDQALKTMPDDPTLHDLRGEVYLLGFKQPRDAAAEFEKTIALKADHLIAYRNLAAARVAMQDREGAIAAYRSGIAATSSPVLAAQLAALYEGFGRYDDAIQVYEELHQKDPQSTIYANNLAMMIATYRSDPASLQQASHLVAGLAGSDNAGYLDTRGWVSYRQGDLNTAVTLLEQAATRMPDNPLVLYHLGKAYHDRGNGDLARRTLEKALERPQPFSGRDDARALLTSMKES